MSGKLSPKWIICFGDYWNRSTMGSPGNIMLEFYKRGKYILWINQIPKLNLTLKKSDGKKSFLLKIIIKRLKMQSKYLIKYKKSFIVLTPIYWPIVESKFGRYINPILYKFQIWIVRIIFNIQSYSICNFTSNNILEYFNFSKVHSFFHIAADMNSDYRIANPVQKEIIIKTEKKIFNKAEKIFPASENIANKIIQKFGHRDKISMLTHGVDVDHFLNVEKNHPSMLTYNKPIIGYFGSLTFANDQDILLEIAKNNFTLVLIGEVSGDYTELKNYSNVFFLGPIQYDDLPKYAIAFDVCIMAWKPSEWIQNCNPKKTLEYMAMGKPIVSISIPHLKNQFNHLIYFADSPKEFVKTIKIALEEDSQDKINKRKEEAKKHDWAGKVQLIYEALGWID